MRSFLQRFMVGRYGPDHLSFAMIILSFILSLLYAILAYMPLIFLSYFIFGLALFRLLSRNIYRRRAENDKFIKYWWPIRTRIKRVTDRIKQARTFKIFKCKKCKNKLRIPRGKGKLQVTCPKCREKMFKKS